MDVMEVIDNKRSTLNPNEDLHFCECGKPADMSCTDAEQTIVNFTTGENAGESAEFWTETSPRYGCKAHPVEPMITFADGRTITAREYESGVR